MVSDVVVVLRSDGSIVLEPIEIGEPGGSETDIFFELVAVVEARDVGKLGDDEARMFRSKL